MSTFRMIASVSLALVSVQAFAHVEPGIYKGVTAAGAVCEMQAIKTYFENEVAHPLNERVLVKVQGTEFTMIHPPVVDVATSKAHFNHDVFQGVAATTKGAQALVIDMIHTETEEGPAAFHWINHEWRADVRNAIDCTGLKLQPAQ